MAFKSNDRTFEKVYGIFDKRDYFNAQGLSKTQIGNFERALKKNDKGAQQILDKFKGDMSKAKDYITQVITDRKKEQAFNDYKAFKAAVDSIQKGKPQYGAVDLVKSRIHNSSQKYTIALYSALRNKKFTKWKDVHNDVDDLIGEGFKSDAQRKAAFANGYEEKGKKKNESINEATIKGRNNKTGESFGMVIGSDKQGNNGYELKVRKMYNSRISAYGFIFDKDSNLTDIRDYGYSLDGKFPDMKGHASSTSVRPNKRETITQIAKITSPAFAKKIYQHVQKNNKMNESVNEIDTKKANLLRTNMPGYVGPKFAKKASDEDILAMADLKDQKARIYNRYVKVVDDAIAKLQKKYRIKESVNEAIKPSQVRSAISRVKKQLMRKWKQKGGYENFGQKELSQMRDKFDYNPYGSSDERQISKMLDAFDNWAMNYDGSMREDGVPQGYNPMVESKTKESKVIQKIYQYSKNEKKFYDELAKHEVRIGQKDYAKFILMALKGFGINPREFKRIPDAEEKLYQTVSK